LSLTTSKIKELQAVGIPFITRSLDIANARLEFENGCTASLTASRISKEKVRKTRIFQPEGIFTIDYLSQKLCFSKKGDSLGKEKIPEMVTEEIPVKKIDLLENEIHSFLQSVRDRKEARVSGLDGKRVLEVALQIIQKIDHLNEQKK
jgi:predicted dehydrogenase